MTEMKGSIISRLIKKWVSVPLEAKASIAYAACSILQRSLSIITLPLFTRLLTTEQYGQSTVYSSWSGLLAIFITLMLWGGSFSTAMVKFENCRDQYITSVEGISILLATLFLVIYWPFRGMWNRLFELPTCLVFVMVAEILASFFINCWQGKNRFEYRYKTVVATTLVTSVLTPVVAFVFVVNTAEKGYARIIGYALVTIAFGGLLFLRSLWKDRRLYTREFWKYALNFNVPLIPYYLSQMIYNQSDRIMISHYCGQDKAGIYGVAYSLALVLGFVLTAINNSYQPWLFRKIKQGKIEENRKVSNMIAVLMAVLLLGLIALAPEIIRVMAGTAYREAIWVVPPVAMSQLLLFYGQLSTSLEFYFEEKKGLVYGTIGAAVLNIVLNALLIPRCGFIAAGYTTLFSYLLLALMHFGIAQGIVKRHGLGAVPYDLRVLFVILIVFLISGFGVMALYERPVARYLIMAGVVIGAGLNITRIVAAVKRVLESYGNSNE